MIAQYHPEVVPEFCPEERVWFTPDGTTARSLRELQAKLPGVKLVGYFPDGFHSKPILPPRPASVTFLEDFDPEKFRQRYDERDTTRQLPLYRPERYIGRHEPEESSLPELPAVEFIPGRMKRFYNTPGVGRGNGAQTAWTEERIERLKSLHDANWSIGRIASELGITRNAVIGKLHRMGRSAGQR